jgi:hypothetical protein|tara:strand:+ start:447 stop:626 length:180 start_codon:yes stop_codon:yes gene_type:complete
MTTWDMRATQKSYKPKTDHNRMDSVEIRMNSIEQSLNLILKKLDNGNNNNGNNIPRISK